MIYLLAILLPPLALLVYGKVFQAIFNLLLCLLALLVGFIWLFFAGAPGLIIWGAAALHAILAINAAQKDARARAIIEAMKAE